MVTEERLVGYLVEDGDTGSRVLGGPGPHEVVGRRGSFPDVARRHKQQDLARLFQPMGFEDLQVVLPGDPLPVL